MSTTVQERFDALRSSLLTVLDNRVDEISPRMHDIIVGHMRTPLWLDERIETTINEIVFIPMRESNCQRLGAGEPACLGQVKLLPLPGCAANRFISIYPLSRLSPGII